MTKCKIKLAPNAGIEYKNITITLKAYKQLINYIHSISYWLPVLFENPLSDIRYKKRRNYPSRVGFVTDSYLQGNKIFMNIDVENEVVKYLNSKDYEVVPYLFRDITREGNDYVINNLVRALEYLDIRIVHSSRKWVIK